MVWALCDFRAYTYPYNAQAHQSQAPAISGLFSELKHVTDMSLHLRECQEAGLNLQVKH